MRKVVGIIVLIDALIINKLISILKIRCISFFCKNS